MTNTEGEKIGEISATSKILSEKTAELHGRLGLLVDKLTPGMRDEEEKPERAVPHPQVDEPLQNKGYGSQLARDLEIVSDKLQAEIAKVNDALERVEI